MATKAQGANWIVRRLLLAGALTATPCLAVAGPPYVTDDPEPTETAHWENYLFATAQGDEGQAGLDLNYGGAKDLQLTAFIPLEWQRSGRRGSATLQGNA